VSLQTPLDTLFFWDRGSREFWVITIYGDAVSQTFLAEAIPFPFQNRPVEVAPAVRVCIAFESKLDCETKVEMWSGTWEGFYAVLVAFHEPISNSCVFCSLATKELECTLPLAGQGFPFHVWKKRALLDFPSALGDHYMVTSSCGQLSLIPMHKQLKERRQRNIRKKFAMHFLAA